MPFPNAATNWARLRALAPDRFDAYRRPSDADELDAIARYIWNIEVSKSMHPKLSVLEVTFRNQLNNALASLYGPTWFDLPFPLSQAQRAEVAKAKQALTRMGRPHDPGRIVAELSFGFWTQLYGKSHEQGIVRPTIRTVFPNYTGPGPLRRSTVAAPLREARLLRNRVSHLEQIVFDVNLPNRHREICEVIRWMHAPMAELSDAVDDFMMVYGQTWRAYRPNAEALFG